MADIDELVAQVWNPASRALTAEVWRCYNAGAVRASIVSLWTTITVDIIKKIGDLADDGDAGAISIRQRLEQAQAEGLKPAGIQQMQDIERDLLDNGEVLELFDSLDKRALERIRDDRNICVHPILRGMKTPYLPRAEVARAHLAVALDTLLIHPPTQGRKLIDRYSDFTSNPIFTPTAALIQNLFYEHVRSGTRRSIAEIAAKHAVLELKTDHELPDAELANRNAQVLIALAHRDRAMVSAAVEKLRDRYAALGGDGKLRTLGRLGDQDFYWDMLDEALVEHLGTLIGKPPTTADNLPLAPTTAAVLSLVSNETARKKLPSLSDAFDNLSNAQQISAISTRPAAYFVPEIITLLRDAGSFNEAIDIAPLLVSHSQFLTNANLDDVLKSCSENRQCRHASAMPPTLLTVHSSTAHLGSERDARFREFLDRIDEHGGGNDGSYYTYPDLRSAVAAGAGPA